MALFSNQLKKIQEAMVLFLSRWFNNTNESPHENISYLYLIKKIILFLQKKIKNKNSG